MNQVSVFNKEQIERINKMRNYSPCKFNVGDTVSVKCKINDSGTSRIQSFAGVVISKTKSDQNYCATFTVRKVAAGFAAERKFPLYSPLVVGIEVLRSGDVRRAKLYYLRKLTGKSSKIKEKTNYSS